jgi:hypothetical protein
MAYKIISPRLGTPGNEYDAEGAAANGINVEALLDAGLIEISTTNTPKPDKPITKTNKKD